jgi:hypothetical protein
LLQFVALALFLIEEELHNQVLCCCRNRVSAHRPAAHACRACAYAGHSDLFRGRTIPAVRCPMARVLRAKRHTEGYYRQTQCGGQFRFGGTIANSGVWKREFPRGQQTPEAIAAIEKAGVEKWAADHESGREQSGVKRVDKKRGDRQRVRAIFKLRHRRRLLLGMY